MHVLVIGSGGREHSLAWKLKQSPSLSRLTCAPGNAGMAQLGTCVALAPEDCQGITTFCQKESVDFVVVGPEVALQAGLVDTLSAAGILAFGPTKAAAQIESSKAFTKQLCDEANIPTAAYASFTEAAPAKSFLQTLSAPYVIKADGLTAGKGVVIAEDLGTAEAAIENMLPAGSAPGARIVIEEFLEGDEISFFVLTDGKSILPLLDAQDHKRAFDGDKGPNTGGMGAYSPAPMFTPEIRQQTLEKIIQPTLDALAARGMPYKGVLYAGLMLTTDGPKLIEYNARFGDPECQIIMILLESDIFPALRACAEETLNTIALDWSEDTAITVVMATKGYPGAYPKGSKIQGVGDAEKKSGVVVFHAGTALENGALIATGGRVLNITARGKNLENARERAYSAIQNIDWPEGFCRTDIGWRALSH